MVVLVGYLSEAVVRQSKPDLLVRYAYKMSFFNLRLGRVNDRFQCRNDLLRLVRTEDSGASYYDIAS